MANNPKKRTPRKKAPLEKSKSVRAIRVPVKKAAKISSSEVESAIRKALASIKSNVFRGSDELVLVLEQFHPNPPKG
jgi:hypothetical protein